MSKVFVDREEIEAVRNTLANGGGAVGVLRWAESILAQPAEAEGVERWNGLKLAAEVAEEDGPWDPRVGLTDCEAAFAKSASPAVVLELIAALSAVTAERDRLESMLIRTATRHFALQIKDRADDKKLDECLSEGIAMLEAERDRLLEEAELHDRIMSESCAKALAERDQLRAEVEASGWIPLTKATPPDGVPVLRWPGWAAEFSIDEWCNDYGCFLMSIEGGERATHWKPLCAPKAAMAAKEA